MNGHSALNSQPAISRRRLELWETTFPQHHEQYPTTPAPERQYSHFSPPPPPLRRAANYVDVDANYGSDPAALPFLPPLEDEHDVSTRQPYLKMRPRLASKVISGSAPASSMSISDLASPASSSAMISITGSTSSCLACSFDGVREVVSANTRPEPLSGIGEALSAALASAPLSRAPAFDEGSGDGDGSSYGNFLVHSGDEEFEEEGGWARGETVLEPLHDKKTEGNLSRSPSSVMFFDNFGY